jgi:hypothetical protein
VDGALAAEAEDAGAAACCACASWGVAEAGLMGEDGADAELAPGVIDRIGAADRLK